MNHEPHIDVLLEALRQGDWGTLIDSSAYLETVDLLCGVVLDSRDEIVRQSATGALGALAELGAPGAVDALLAVLRQLEKSYARDIAAFYLVGCGDVRAEAVLLRILGDPHHNGHMAVVRALAEVGDPRAVDPLIAVLNNSRMPTRYELVRVLGDYDDVRVVFPLLRLLHHDDERVCAAAHHALFTFADKYAFGMLIEYLTHPDYTARRQAAIALGEIGSKRAIRPLIRLADGEGDERVQQAIGDALQKLGYAYSARSG
ncbi:MAG: HEAT repeat domain-containing protein [Anaerolineae bacterium]|nr:HEAT repeat domain-containing protein [Anaerolineae bacterium]